MESCADRNFNNRSKDISSHHRNDDDVSNFGHSDLLAVRTGANPSTIARIYIKATYVKGTQTIIFREVSAT